MDAAYGAYAAAEHNTFNNTNNSNNTAYNNANNNANNEKTRYLKPHRLESRKSEFFEYSFGLPSARAIWLDRTPFHDHFSIL